MNKTVLVTGANGYIGRAVCNSFSHSGWVVYGLIRNPKHASDLALHEIIPVIGSCADLAFLDSNNLKSKIFDVIVSTTEDLANYAEHFNNTLAFAKALSKAANDAGKKPLLLFTSGVKDTGESGLVGSPDFTIHDEASPLNPPPLLAARAHSALTVFNHPDHFHGIVMRPSLVYGYNSSWYGAFFHAFASTKTGDTIRMVGNLNTVWHGAHVDDVAAAYVALAEKYFSSREEAHGQIFVVANEKWETMGEIVDALQAPELYGERRIEWREPDGNKMAEVLHAFSQAVRTEKIRHVTGWREKRIGFVEGVEVYKAAWEEAVRVADQGALKILRRIEQS